MLRKYYINIGWLIKESGGNKINMFNILRKLIKILDSEEE